MSRNEYILQTEITAAQNIYWRDILRKNNESWILNHSIWKTLCEEMSDKSRKIYFIESHNKFGFCLLEDHYGEYMLIYFIFVCPKDRLKGVARNLIESVLKSFPETIFIAEPTNIAANTLCKKIGFRNLCYKKDKWLLEQTLLSDNYVIKYA